MLELNRLAIERKLRQPACVHIGSADDQYRSFIARAPGGDLAEVDVLAEEIGEGGECLAVSGSPERHHHLQ